MPWKNALKSEQRVKLAKTYAAINNRRRHFDFQVYGTIYNILHCQCETSHIGDLDIPTQLSFPLNCIKVATTPEKATKENRKDLLGRNTPPILQILSEWQGDLK
jgi:hypothetical protein